MMDIIIIMIVLILTQKMNNYVDIAIECLSILLMLHILILVIYIYCKHLIVFEIEPKEGL